MEQILIVDDDAGFLLSLKDMLASGRQNYSILTAHNGLEALKVLATTPVNLVVTDLKMPEMDGFDLLANLSASRPETPVIVMTAYGTPEMENRLRDMGAFQYIEKPIDFNLLLKKIANGLSSGAQGHIDGISLSSFMQLLQLDQKTCTLNVHYLGKTGVLYFQQGELTHAAAGHLSGQDAAIEIASWEKARIEIINICKYTERTIAVPLGFILIESARQKDEMDGGTPGEDETDTVEEKARRQKTEQILREARLHELDFDHTAPSVEIDEEQVESLIETSPADTLAAAADAPPPTGKSEAAPAEEADLPGLFAELEAMTGLGRMIAIAKGGKVLAKKDAEVKKFGNLVAYAVAAAEQMGKGLGFTSIRQMILTQANGNKLLILSGPRIILGLEVQGHIDISPLVASLRPRLARTTV